MKDKEFLNICYKALNRMITINELIEKLENIDKDCLDKVSIEKINNFILDVKKVDTDIPNVIDEYVKNKKEKIKNLIKKMEAIPKDEHNEDFINRELKSLKNSYEKEIDSVERWKKVVDLIFRNEYFNESYDSLSKEDLLVFITQYIQVPIPPSINQDEFDELVKIGIEKDEKEKLWRLAFNYQYKNMNLDNIIDYFIKVKDGYYLCELISAVGDVLDIDKIIDKIEDKELINEMINRKNVINYFVKDKHFDILESKLNA